jgi:hypothetical protein
MDAAAHATSVAPFALGGSTLALGAGGPSVASRAVGRALGVSGGERMQALAAVSRPLTLYPGQPESCPYGGTLQLTIDDRNENGMFDVGDVMSFIFDQCQLEPGRVMNGTQAIEPLRVDSAGFGGRMTLTQYAEWTTDGRHRVTTNGSALVDYADTSSVSGWQRMQVEGVMTIAVEKHGPYVDTVTLQSGFWQHSNWDGVGSTMTFGGELASVAAGGRMATSSPTPFAVLQAEPYPHAGVAQATGNHGRLTITALSINDIKVGLDYNDCGTDENTQAMAWDELI